MMLVTLETLKKHIGGIQTKLSFDTVLPFVRTAERDFKRNIGAELYDFLGTDTSELRECAEGCICWTAYDMALPHLKQRVGDLGMAKNSPANTIAITKWEYVDTREANMAMADLFFESFWLTLEETRPQVWTDSESYKIRRSLFLRSADELGSYVPLVGRNRRFFGELVKFIQRAESLYIADSITEPVLEKLKTRYQDSSITLSTVENTLIEKIRFALAYLTLHEAYPYLPLLVDHEGVRQIRKKDGIREEDIADKSYRQAQRRQLWQDAQLYLAQLRKFMDQNASAVQFPEYYTANLIEDEAEDYTHKPHILL
ncbi:hypothetical protein DYBT9275_00925 [Dyadobacter sp. CECT 9275]|uniref:Uncharacterized protein n=1 Tax=Dyadobacter helix TaxID=2822344 RepID=A0A916NAR6_9BACT|nr:DUF6712 family protein [Dyadobacter sp. CECT 9275]CAG4992256.1 hypothetical protein DYBT9275_00925 [Dyadobacter sp. CECT 9275]